MKYFTIILRARVNATRVETRFFFTILRRTCKRSDRRTTFGGSFYNDNTLRERNVSVRYCHKRTVSRLNNALSTNLCSLCDVFPRIPSGFFFLLNHFVLRETKQNCNRCATWCIDCTDEVTACAKYLSIHISTPVSLSFSLPVVAQAPRSHPPYRSTLKVRGVS